MGAEWVATPRLAGDAAGVLRNYDGIVIAPGSPYRSMEGAIDAIRFGRPQRWPLTGN